MGLASAIIGTVRLLPYTRETTNAVNVSPSVTLPGASEAHVGVSRQIRF